MADATGTILNGNYLPRHPIEKHIYESLWLAAGPEGDSLAGKPAVDFFSKSTVDTGILRQIWTLCTPGGALSKEQFFSALRYIALVQNGEIPISKEKLASTASIVFPPPKLNGVQIPPMPAPAPPPQAYLISADENAKLLQLFAQYDLDHDGFLLGSEAVPIFSKSGLDVNVLRIIWEYADHDKDNKLNAKEFAVAFHLILCITKKGLPLPQGGLPSTLIAYLESSAVANFPPQTTVPVSVAHVPAPQPVAHVPAPQPVVPTQPAKPLTVTDAFGALDSDAPIEPLSVPASVTTQSRPVQPTPTTYAPAPAAQKPTLPHTTSGPVQFSDSEQHDVISGVQALSESAKKLQHVHEASMEGSDRALGSLKFVIQKLATEKISLSATVNTADAEVQEMQGKFQQAVNEINALIAELDELKKKHAEILQAKGKTQQNLSQAGIDRVQIIRNIEDTRKEIARLSDAKVEVAQQIGEANSQLDTARSDQNRVNNAIQDTAAQIANAGNEIAVLRELLARLGQERVAVKNVLSNMQTDLQGIQSTVSREKHVLSQKEQELHKLKEEQKKQSQEINHIVTQIASSENIKQAPVPQAPQASAVPQNPPAPIVPVTSSPIKIDKKESVNSFDSIGAKQDSAKDFGFENDAFASSNITKSNDAADPFSSAGPGFGNDGFGSSSHAASDVFGGIPMPASNDGFGDDGFGSPNKKSDDFGFGTATSSAGDFGFAGNDDGFGSSGGGGFDDSAGGEDAFGSVTSKADDAFGNTSSLDKDAFGTSSENDAFGSSVQNDAFGAAGSFDNDAFGSSAQNDAFGAAGSFENDAFGAAGSFDNDAFGSTENDAFGSSAQNDAFGTSVQNDDAFGSAGSFGNYAFGSTSDDFGNDNGFGAADVNNGFGSDAFVATNTTTESANTSPPKTAATDSFTSFGDFGSSNATQGASDGFDAFGASAGGGDFGAFGSLDATSSSGFGDFGDDGFGSTKSPAADDGFGF